MSMNFKTNFLAISIFTSIVTTTISAPFLKIFGKNYNLSKDFSCCMGDKLVIHHYYTVNILWMEVTNGYTKEIISKPNAGGCVIRCAE